MPLEIDRCTLIWNDALSELIDACASMQTGVDLRPPHFFDSQESYVAPEKYIPLIRNPIGTAC